MECHPPLGKLLIALGEVLLSPNGDTTPFAGVEAIKELPANLKVGGFRLFPTLAGWLATLVVFLFSLTLSRSPWLALVCSAPILFDNATIVHSRAAMLDSFTILFLTVVATSFAVLVGCRDTTRASLIRRDTLAPCTLGLAVGLALATKVNTIVFFFAPALYLYLRFIDGARQGVTALLQILISCGLGLCAPWLIHIWLGQFVNPHLQNSGYYGATMSYREVLDAGESPPTTRLPTIISDNLRFARKHHQGVPTLNQSLPGENGSPPWHWPFGGKAIAYRWSTGGEKTAYIYLQSNPAVWGLGLASILAGVFFIVFKRRIYPTHWKIAVLLFTMYVVYMGMVLTIKRVLYLYHYLIPLHISLLLGITMLSAVWPNLTKRMKGVVTTLISTGIITCYAIFYPLTYNVPISDEHLRSLNWLPVWKLTCGKCRNY